MNVNIMNVDYSTKIPNNVNLSEDRQVLKALEGWHPGYMDWWSDMGPEGFQQSLVYLRTAYSVDPRGWAKFDYVKMPDYRWGVLLAPQEENRKIPFGEHFGEPAWQNWIFQRPNAVGEDGALRRYGTGQKAQFDMTRV